jgi:hypothetical protein
MKNEIMVRIYRIGVHPDVRVNCLNLPPHGVLATHKAARAGSRGTRWTTCFTCRAWNGAEGRGRSFQSSRLSSFCLEAVDARR